MTRPREASGRCSASRPALHQSGCMPSWCGCTAMRDCRLPRSRRSTSTSTGRWRPSRSTPTAASCGSTSSTWSTSTRRSARAPGRHSARTGGRGVRRVRAAIRAAGGIDFQLLGIGKTGHIGFNEPGSGDDSRTRLVTLDAVTRRDAAADFFGEQNVPRQAITMGVATILEAREILHPRDRRAQGRHRAPGGRGRGGPRRRGDLPAASPERHRLLRRGRRRRTHADGDAVAAR